MLKNSLFYGMFLLYLAAGINHFVNPEFYEKIMPSYIPFHLLCVFLSGIVEILLAFLLIPKATRKTAAWLIITMLVVFFVIHIQMVIDTWTTGGMLFWIAISRIPLQFVLIWWAYLYTKNPQPKG